MVPDIKSVEQPLANPPNLHPPTADSEIGTNFYGWSGVDFRFFSIVRRFLWKKNGGFGASPARTSVASIPAGGVFLFSSNVTFAKEHVSNVFSSKMSLICHQLEEPSIKPASWTL